MLRDEGLLMVEIELRVPPATARAAIVAGLLCFLGQNSISEDMAFNTGYTSPSGVYAGLTTMGLSEGGGALNTLLSLDTASRARIQSADATAGVKLHSTLSMMVGPAGSIPGTLPGAPASTIYTTGPDSGIGVVVRGSGNNFSIQPEGGDLVVYYLGAPAGSGGGFRLGPPPAGHPGGYGFKNLCSDIPYTFGVTTSCPSHEMVIGTARYTIGTMTCCRLGLRTFN